MDGTHLLPYILYFNGHLHLGQFSEVFVESDLAFMRSLHQKNARAIYDKNTKIFLHEVHCSEF